MERWNFGVDNDQLIDLVLSRKKTATSYLYNVDSMPIVGEESIICFDNQIDACIVKAKDYRVLRYKDMTEDLAILEGEGDLSLDYWKKVHYDFFKSIDSSFNENTKIIFETFEVVKILI